MYSNKSNIRQLVSLLAANHIENMVLCPGSRNSPIVETIVTCGKFTCHSVVDERSAGFYAMGMYLATNKYAAVCCTSGTALLNLAPSVAEAYYQQIPLLIISADRPKRWINQMDGQTLTQTGVFNDYIKKEVQLAEGDDEETRWYNNRMINEALCSMSYAGYGPVHINVPISEPLFDFTDIALPDERRIHIVNTDSVPNLAECWNSAHKVMIVCGQFYAKNAPNMFHILRDKGCVVLCEILSNYQFNDNYITNFDSALYKICKDKKDKAFVPDLIISMGGHVVSKRLKKFLRENEVRHWAVNANGNITDTYMNIEKVLVCSEMNFINEVGKLPQRCDEFQKSWWNLSRAISKSGELYFQSIKTEMSAMTLMGELMSRMDDHYSLFLANSMTVRLAQLFHTPGQYIPTYCNRGVNGIEGSLSTAVGYASRSEDICVAVIGDLSFFYDMNVLRHACHLTNLRILLINNGGGGIFDTLHGLENAVSLNGYVAANHQTNAEGWATGLGFGYMKITQTSQIENALELLLDANSKRPVLIEASTDAKIDKKVFNNYFKSL